MNAVLNDKAFAALEALTRELVGVKLFTVMTSDITAAQSGFCAAAAAYATIG